MCACVCVCVCVPRCVCVCECLRARACALLLFVCVFCAALHYTLRSEDEKAPTCLASYREQERQNNAMLIRDQQALEAEIVKSAEANRQVCQASDISINVNSR